MDLRYVHKWREKGYIPPGDEAGMEIVTWKNLWYYALGYRDCDIILIYFMLWF
jgi:hypothetical protein